MPRRQVVDFKKDQQDSEEKEEFVVPSNKKKPKKFAQTTFKYHKYNPKLLRLQEMNRTF